MKTAPLLLIVTACVPLHGVAQIVSGVVVEEGAGTPVPGAMVLLVDNSGTTIDRALTDAAGRFVVNAHATGVHHIAVERIGYADWSTDPFRATAAGTVLTIEVPLEPIAFADLEVSGRQRCADRPEDGAATHRLWKEARKALAAELFTREAGTYRYGLRRYERALDRDANDVLDETITPMRFSRAAFESFPIEHLTTRGFVQTADDTMRVHYAPDAEALLSDAFLDSHCFGVLEGEGDRIGLTFEPLPESRQSEIEGILWLNAATSELELVEFLYRYPLRDREVGRPGGEVAFTRLPNGTWIVREWAIRMPDLVQIAGGRIRRMGYKEVGGITWAITDARGLPVMHAEFASVSGVVTDSTGTGPPAAPVVVAVRGTGLRVVTEEDGSFLLIGLEEGRHQLAVQHPLLVEWGVPSPTEVEVDGWLGEVAHASLRAPKTADVLAASCGGTPRPPGTAVLLGRIAAPGGTPLEEMRVVATWPRASGYTPPPIAAPTGPEGAPDRSWRIDRDDALVTATTTTGRRGLFLLCDVPGGSQLRVDVLGPLNDDPLLTENFDIDSATGAVVEVLVVPAGNGPGGPE